MRVTVETVMSWRPCGWDGPDNGKNYTTARVRRLFGRRKYMTALHILDLVGQGVPAEDVIWGALHRELIEERIMRLFACDVAERALKRERKTGREPDPRSWEAVRVSRLYAAGKATREELAAAWAAAREAARAAAWAARAAREAAMAAAREVAGAAERKWQVEHLRKLLRESR